MDGGTNTTGTKNNQEGGVGRRVMVVADPTRESAGALQYALSHAMVDKDELILLHVMSKRPGTFGSLSLSSIFKRQQQQQQQDQISATSAHATATSDAGFLDGGGIIGLFGGAFGDLSGRVGGGGGDFLEVMKKACEATNPKLKVRVDKVEQGSMDKATTILFRSKLLSIDLLIIGQRRNLSSVLLGPRRNGGARNGPKSVDTAEYLIENSMCTCVGVQKKGQNAGYLLNTKTHRNFWLLA